MGQLHTSRKSVTYAPKGQSLTHHTPSLSHHAVQQTVDLRTGVEFNTMRDMEVSESFVATATTVFQVLPPSRLWPKGSK